MTNRPNKIVYQPVERKTKDGKTTTFFHRIGAMWKLESGKGYSMQLDLLPTQTRLVLLSPKEKKAEGASAS